MSVRTCSRCKERKPISEFRRPEKDWDCKSCQVIDNRERLKRQTNERAKRIKEGVALLVECKKCHKVKSEEEFYLSIRNTCKKCRSKKDKANYRKNPNVKKAYAIKWNKNNPGKKREIAKAYREKNKAHFAAYAKEWRRKNSDRIKQNYREKHPLKIKPVLSSEEKRRRALKYKKAYYQKNREAILKMGKKWRANNPGKIREKSMREYWADTEKAKERRKKWRKNNPERERRYMLKAKEELSDSYVRCALRLRKDECPSVLVEVKREQMRLERVIQQQEESNSYVESK